MASPRWHGALAVLAEMRRTPGVTRAAVVQRLGLSSGSATEITARLRELALLTETPAAVTGRGRPTTVLAPHPDGPVVVAVDLRYEDWRCAVAGLDGRPTVLDAAPHASREPDRVLDAVGRAVRRGPRHPRRCRRGPRRSGGGRRHRAAHHGGGRARRHARRRRSAGARGHRRRRRIRPPTVR